MIYLDNAATSLHKPPAVGKAILAALESFGGAGRGGHSGALAASRCIFCARSALAGLLGSAPQRIAFSANATESLNIAINGLLTPADHVITTALEHNSVLRPLYRLRGRGMNLSVVSIDSGGNLDYDGFRIALRSNTKAVVCTHASNLIGALVDMDFVSCFCRDNNLLLIVDAAQTAGVFPINADEMGIDVLCFTGHKGLLGPQGTGGLCVRQGLEMQPYKVGGSGMHSYSELHPTDMPDVLEAGTLNAHGIAGLLAGIEYIESVEMDSIRSRELALARQFRDAVSAVPSVRVYGNPDVPHAPIVAINVADMSSGTVGDLLSARYDICARAGAHCAPLAHIALGTKEQGAVRFSFSSFNTADEVDIAIRAIHEIVGER